MGHAQQAYLNDKVEIVVLGKAEKVPDDFNAINVSVYPNPTINKINIQSDEQITNVVVYNTLGQMVKSGLVFMALLTEPRWGKQLLMAVSVCITKMSANYLAK